MTAANFRSVSDCSELESSIQPLCHSRHGLQNHAIPTIRHHFSVACEMRGDEAFLLSRIMLLLLLFCIFLFRASHRIVP